LRDLLQRIHDQTGRKVSLVGWSLGGVYARDLALQMPDMVRSVITLGSPFANDIRATNATRLYEALSGEAVDDNPDIREAIAGDLPVPATSIYSRTDGIVNWHTSLLRPPARRKHRGVLRQPYRARRQPRSIMGGGRPSGAARGGI
jgi:pimeloyl-ACP methyl ester carboxylesterase